MSDHEISDEVVAPPWERRQLTRYAVGELTGWDLSLGNGIPASSEGFQAFSAFPYVGLVLVVTWDDGVETLPVVTSAM